MTQLEKDLKEICESPDTLQQLRELINEYGKKRGIYFVLNRLPKRGWILYSLQDGGKQIWQEMGLGILERLFDSPITSLKKHLRMEF